MYFIINFKKSLLDHSVKLVHWILRISIIYVAIISVTLFFIKPFNDLFLGEIFSWIGWTVVGFGITDIVVSLLCIKSHGLYKAGNY